ncbi:hypothetical protein HZB90_04265 [archaeon]|nr:hypothetical protein [archaeon]
MPGFDPNLDKEIWSESVTLGISKLKVSIMSYNDGAPKMQISRERLNQSGEGTFAKLGRLTLDEVNSVMPLMEKAKEHLPASGNEE